jgi:DNA polymerase-1
MSEDKHLILIDGSGYIFRAYHALPPMTRPDGIHVNAVFGFCQILSRFLEAHSASHIAVVFDTARVTFRNEFYPQYKAHRPDPPKASVASRIRANCGMSSSGGSGRCALYCG